MKKFHAELGFPSTLIIPDRKELKLFYTYHALSASKTDRYGVIKLPETIVLNKSEIIEIESFDCVISTKVLIRTSYSDDCDLCMAILLGENKVKTVWLNKKSDKHKTLDASKYSAIKC